MTELSPDNLPFVGTASLSDTERRKARICNIVYYNTTDQDPWVSRRAVKLLFSNGTQHTGSSSSERAETAETTMEDAEADGLLLRYDDALTIGTQDRLKAILEGERNASDSDQALVGTINEFKKRHH